MKALLVSDLHYTLKQFDWVNSVADDFDVVVMAGDHLDIASSVPLDAQIPVIIKYLRRLKDRVHLLVCSGNHDLNDISADGEKVASWMSRVRQLGVPCDGESIDIEGVRVTVCPWWDGPRVRDQIAAQLAEQAGKHDGPWIWIYHAPPDDSPTSWAGKRHFGDTELLAWIRQYQPDMVLCGHIHQSPFKSEGSWVDRIGSTWVMNPGNQIGPIPTHIVIDTGEKQAQWYSLAGTESIALDGPSGESVSPVAQ